MCVCNPRNVAKSNLDGRGWAWAEQIGQSAGEVDLSPHQGHGQHQAIAHPGFPSQGQPRVPDSNKISAIGKLVVYHKGPQLVSTLPGVVSRNLSFLSPV